MTRDDIARLSKKTARKKGEGTPFVREALNVALLGVLVPLLAVGLGCLLALLLAPTVDLIQHVFFGQ